MTRDGILCFLGFQNFLGEDPRTPLSLVCCNFYSPTLLNTRLVGKGKYTTQGVETHTRVGSASIVCDLLAKDLLYPICQIQGWKRPRSSKSAKKFNVNLLFGFNIISVKQPLLRLKESL